MTIPKVPEGATAAGKKLWAAVLGEYDFDDHEIALLRELIRTMALLDQLDEIARAEGPMQASPQGQRAHPAVVEARQQRITLARLQAALRLPAGDEGEGMRRPQRRGGARAPYGIRGVV